MPLGLQVLTMLAGPVDIRGKALRSPSSIVNLT